MIAEISYNFSNQKRIGHNLATYSPLPTKIPPQTNPPQKPKSRKTKAQTPVLNVKQKQVSCPV
jgi:hypothetical protein